MSEAFEKIISGYLNFRKKYATGDHSVMQRLAYNGQQPKTMIVACCDSRVDPALILESDPGDLFIVRNVANIIPPLESGDGYLSTSAALEFAIRHLNIKHLIIMGHSQCGGIEALIQSKESKRNDFITRWMSLVNTNTSSNKDSDTLTKLTLSYSHNNCLTFPWIKKRVDNNELTIHRWFFDIKSGEISVYSVEEDSYQPLI